MEKIMEYPEFYETHIADVIRRYNLRRGRRSSTAYPFSLLRICIFI